MRFVLRRMFQENLRIYGRVARTVSRVIQKSRDAMRFQTFISKATLSLCQDQQIWSATALPLPGFVHHSLSKPPSFGAAVNAGRSIVAIP